MEQRTRSQVDQDNDANECLALQDSRTDSQGNLDTHLGLQSDSYSYGAGCEQARHRAATISFKGALQFLDSFQLLIDYQGYRGRSFRNNLYQQLLNSIALHCVANRPDRFEPRYKKRKYKRFFEMQKPRWEMKIAMLKGQK